MQIKIANMGRAGKSLCLIVGLFLGFQLLYIVMYGKLVGCPETNDSLDAVVVFGNKVYPNGQPSPILKSRLDEAYKISQDTYCNKTGYIIVSGGLGKEGVYEGDAMAEYLKGLGYPADKILIDNHGDDTHQTAINASRIASEHGFHSLLLVTSYYHVLRSVYAFKQVGLTKVEGQGSSYLSVRDLFAIPRELLAVYSYAFRY